MNTGTARRQETGDSLAGAAQVVATPKSAPSLSLNAAPVPQVNSLTQQIGRSLQEWATSGLSEMANKENEAAQLEGQMAYQQGKAMEDVEMGGNKWALNGYRVMQAQTVSSSMMAAQQTLIKQTGYQDDPDTFRAQYVSQLEQQIDGLDPSTAKMVRETMTNQMPTLVAQHTSAHLEYQENQNFTTLSASIDTISKDPTATDQLLSAAMGGPGSASAGLSDDRRRKAVTEGVVSAFTNGNAQAYSKLKQAGALDDLSPTDKQSIARAEASFQKSLRDNLSIEFIASHNTLMKEIETGTISGRNAEEKMSILYADHGMKINAMESNAVYVASENMVDYHVQGDTFLLKQAERMGEDNVAAAIRERIKAQGGPRPADAKERLVQIEATAKEMQDMQDIEAEGEMRIQQIAIDAALEAGELDAQGYLRASSDNRKAFGVKASRSITSRLVTSIEETHKKVTDEISGEQREIVDAQYQILKAQYESTLSHDITPEQAAQEATAHRNSVIELYKSHDVSFADMKYSNITANIMGTYFTAAEKGRKLAEERTLISHAARTGTVSNLTNKQQRTYFKEQAKGTVDEISALLDTGEVTEQEAPARFQEAIMGSYLSAGMVDPQIKAQSVAAIGITKGAALNTDGSLTQQGQTLLKTVETYANLSEADRRVSNTMLDETSRLRAEQIITAAGGPGGDLQSGAIRYFQSFDEVGGFQPNTPEITDKTIRRARKAVRQELESMDVTMFEGLFPDAVASQRLKSERSALFSPETQEKFESLVLAEATRLSFLDQGSDTRLMIPTAMQNVRDRTTFLGNTPVIMQQGKGIKEQMFGNNIKSVDGNPDVVNDAVIGYLRDLSEKPGYEFISEIGLGAQMLSNIGSAIGIDVDRDVIGASDLIGTVRRGVRPFTVVSNGTNVAVRITLEQGGPSTPINLPLKEIGDKFLAKRQSDLAKRDWEF